MTDMARGNKKRIRQQNKGFFARLASQWQLALMSVPILLYVLLFNYAPMWGWITAFQDYKPKLGITGSKFVGLKNFQWLFSRADFIESIRNTLAMSVINLVFGTVSAIVLAVLLNEVRLRSFKRTVQTVTYLPHFLSMVIVVGMAQNIFSSNGAINQLLLSLGLTKEPVFFLGEGRYFWWLVGVINVWKEVGWNTIIYISAMTAIDPSLYEAAAIDGAHRGQQIWYITLPFMLPLIMIQLILQIGNILAANTELILLMYNSSVYSSMDVIGTYVYRDALQGGRFSYGTASGLLLSIMSFILVYIANKVSAKTTDFSLW